MNSLIISMLVSFLLDFAISAPVNKAPTDADVANCQAMKTDFYALADRYNGMESFIDEICDLLMEQHDGFRDFSEDNFKLHKPRSSLNEDTRDFWRIRILDFFDIVTSDVDGAEKAAQFEAKWDTNQTIDDSQLPKFDKQLSVVGQTLGNNVGYTTDPDAWWHCFAFFRTWAFDGHN